MRNLKLFKTVLSTLAALVAASAISYAAFTISADRIMGAGSAPAVTSCGGGSPAIAGTDMAGAVTMGTTATGCIITFNVARATAPYCLVTWIASPLASQSYVTAATGITLTQTSTSSNQVRYFCVDAAGG